MNNILNKAILYKIDTIIYYIIKFNLCYYLLRKGLFNNILLNNPLLRRVPSPQLRGAGDSVVKEYNKLDVKYYT